MVKSSEGTSTSSAGSSTVHTLARKTHLCLLPGAWLLERVGVGTEGPLEQPGSRRCCRRPPLSPALRPHLVKRSQGLAPWPSSGADQWQSIRRMLLLWQLNAPAPGPGNSEHGSHRGRFRAGLGRVRIWQLMPSDGQAAQEKVARAGPGGLSRGPCGAEALLTSGRQAPAQFRPSPPPGCDRDSPACGAAPTHPETLPHPHLLHPPGRRRPGRHRYRCRSRSGAGSPPHTSGPRSPRSSLEQARLRSSVQGAFSARTPPTAGSPFGSPGRGAPQPTAPTRSPPIPSPCPRASTRTPNPSLLGFWTLTQPHIHVGPAGASLPRPQPPARVISR